MNHKRHRPKSRRAGCLMCKCHKVPGQPKHSLFGHAGFGKLRREAAARHDLRAAQAAAG